MWKLVEEEEGRVESFDCDSGGRGGRRVWNAGRKEEVGGNRLGGRRVWNAGRKEEAGSGVESFRVLLRL